MTPLFCSFIGNKNGVNAYGWAVIRTNGSVSDAGVIEKLSTELEAARGFDTGSLVLLSFQRLEAPLMPVYGSREVE